MQERILCSQGKASKDIAPQSREIFTDVCMVAGGGGGGAPNFPPPQTADTPYIIFGNRVGWGGGGGGAGGGEFTNLPLTIQAFVNFSDFSRLDLCWLSTNHFQIWRLY